MINKLLLYQKYKRNKTIDKDGYILIYCPDHPFANYYGYIREHRLIYELHYSCILLPYTIIHHIDHDRLNNEIENLMPLYNGQHTALHNKKDMSNRLCLLCDNNTTYIKTRKYYLWFKHENGFICLKCKSKNRYYLKKLKK